VGLGVKLSKGVGNGRNKRPSLKRRRSRKALAASSIGIGAPGTRWAQPHRLMSSSPWLRTRTSAFPGAARPRAYPLRLRQGMTYRIHEPLMQQTECRHRHPRSSPQGLRAPPSRCTISSTHLWTNPDRERRGGSLSSGVGWNEFFASCYPGSAEDTIRIETLVIPSSRNQFQSHVHGLWSKPVVHPRPFWESLAVMRETAKQCFGMIIPTL